MYINQKLLIFYLFSFIVWYILKVIHDAYRTDKQIKLTSNIYRLKNTISIQYYSGHLFNINHYLITIFIGNIEKHNIDINKHK